MLLYKNFSIIDENYFEIYACEKLSTRFEVMSVVIPHKEAVGAPAMGAKAHCIPFKQPEELSSDAGCICRGWGNKPKYCTQLCGCSC